jgi:hypothetical protein
LKAAHKRGYFQGFYAGAAVGAEDLRESIAAGFTLGYRSGAAHQQAVCDSELRLSGPRTSLAQEI